MILAVKYVPSMYATVWALVPPVVAIVLALITKEVYSSLFVGIVIGGLFYGNVFQSGFSAERSVLHIFEDGLVGVLSDPDNVGILIFLVVLGVMVSMMNKAGGSAAFGEWASEHIKTRIGAQLAAIMLGVLILLQLSDSGKCDASCHRQASGFQSKACISDRCHSSARVHHCTYIIVGSRSHRLCKGRGWLFYFHKGHSVQLLCALYHCRHGDTCYLAGGFRSYGKA